MKAKLTVPLLAVITCLTFTECNSGTNASTQAQIQQTDANNAAVRQQQLAAAKENLTKANADVDAAQADLNEAEKFHVGRTDSQKQKDVDAASYKLEKAKEYAKQCQDQVNNLQ